MSRLRRPVIALTSLLLLAPAASAVAAQPTASAASTAHPQATTVQSQQRATYDVTIKITEHGIPHITSDTFEGMAYGAGWATMSAATCNLLDTLLTARGQRSKYLGPDARWSDNVGGSGTNLEWDVLVGDLRKRKVVERLLADKVAGPTERAKAMVVAEAVAINDWLEANEITDPACADRDWVKPDITATDVWYAYYLAQLISSTTRFLPEIMSAAPPTGSARADEQAAQGSRAAVRALREQSFGSNATAVGGDSTSTGRGMLLGNPHFPWMGRYRFTQMHLTVPGEFDAAGGALTGFTAINIGFNKDVAWSHTVSTGYRFTPYQYQTAGSPMKYKTAKGVRKVKKRFVRVQVRTEDGLKTVTRNLYRTPQGYVISAPSLYMPWTRSSLWAMRDANAEHLRTPDTFLSMGMATSVRDLLRRQDRGGGMPWVNTIAADRSGDVLYADHSVVPHVTEKRAQRCMTNAGRLLYAAAGLPGLDGTRASTTCKWGTDKDAQRPGILGARRLPSVVTRDWVMNANDSYWAPNDTVRLTGFPRIVGCENCERSMRTKVVMSYVRDQLEVGKETPETLASHQYANRVYAGEVAREGGRLDQVCDATGLTEACEVLRAWDGTSNVDSRGAAIFQEFVRHASRDGVRLWEVPFSAADPLNTPNTLSTAPEVVETLAKAITTITDRGFALDAPYGDLHRAGDRGDAEAGIPLGGGLGNLSGDANVTQGSGGDQVLDPVGFGSSYIQSIAFVGESGIDARTVLTYSQYEDPASAWSRDQTRIYSEEGWVDFPWTEAEIAEQLVDTIHLTSS